MKKILLAIAILIFIPKISLGAVVINQQDFDANAWIYGVSNQSVGNLNNSTTQIGGISGIIMGRNNDVVPSALTVEVSLRQCVGVYNPATGGCSGGLPELGAWNATTITLNPGESTTATFNSGDLIRGIATSTLDGTSEYVIILATGATNLAYVGSTNQTFRVYWGQVGQDCQTTVCNGGYKTPYFVLATDGSSLPPVNPDSTLTRIQAISPVNNASSSQPVNLQAQYYLNSQTNTSSSSIPTHIRWQIWNAVYPGNVTTLYEEINPVFDSITTVSTSSFNGNNNQKYVWTVALVSEVPGANCQNPLVAAAICAFQQLQQNIVAEDYSGNIFTIGLDPTESIENYVEGIFNQIDGQQNSPSIFGQCTLVATSTCDATSPSTYQGCLINALIATFCPSSSVINYATSTLMGSMQNKVPFGFFFTISSKLNALGSTTPIQGQNVTVNIEQLGNATTTIFSWQEAHDFMHDVIPDYAVEIMSWVLWLIMTGFTIWIIFKIF